MNGTAIRWAEFESVCAKELELRAPCEGEIVIVPSQAGDRLDYADAFVSAA